MSVLVSDPDVTIHVGDALDVLRGLPDAHFATFPEELPRRCVLAGCPEWVCGTCHKPRVRIVERTPAAVLSTGGTYDRR